MMTTRQRHRVFWFGLAVLVIAFAMLMGSCNGPHQTITTVHDSTHTESITSYRDTVLVMRSDSATLDVSSDLKSVQLLLEELKHQVRTIHGERNATLVLSNDGGQLHIAARCDSVQMRLDSAIKVINTLTTRSREVVQQTTVSAPSDRHAMPGWAKGILVAVLCIIALLITIKIVFKL